MPLLIEEGRDVGLWNVVLVLVLVITIWQPIYLAILAFVYMRSASAFVFILG